MGRAEAGSTKAMGNAIKAKGLGRLRFYCQVCERQLRDENGFQAHCKTEPHLRKMMSVGQNAGATIAEFSRQFQYDFVTLLKSRHNTKRVRANAVYNEYIQDKHHVHMNATRWVTLSGFIQTLGKAGIVKVDEDEREQLWIQWVDNTPSTLSKHAAMQKKERAQMDGEERERKMIEDQIARARAAAGAGEVEQKGIERKEGEKVTLSLSLKPAEAEESASPASAGASPAPPSETKADDTKTSIGGFSSFGKIAVANPLKRPASNVFKSASSSKSAKTDDKPKAFVSEAERLMREDQARKARGGYQGAGPRRGGR